MTFSGPHAEVTAQTNERIATMNRWISLIIVFLATTATAFAAQPALTGTWLTTVTPPAESGVPPFQLVFTFGADGTLLATGTSGELPALGNPCHGVWDLAGPARARVTYVCFDFDGSLQNTGRDKIRGSFDLTTSTLRGRLDLTNFDPQGNQVFSACCATVEGTRLEVEELQDSADRSENERSRKR
jgi:hypothetical protein